MILQYSSLQNEIKDGAYKLPQVTNKCESDMCNNYIAYSPSLPQALMSLN